jgi:integrative and conjugative element protein (TIGR02256 family)
MPEPLNLAWIELHAFAELKRQGSDTMPFETGGCLMGYWAKEFTEVVITHIIGPGPHAAHGKFYFFPDSSWQDEEIAKIYSDTDRLITYLGDWHSHPADNSSLSFIDKWTMMRIGQHKAARVKSPLMGVIHTPPYWDLTIYCKRKRTKARLYSGREYVRFQVKEYRKEQ